MSKHVRQAAVAFVVVFAGAQLVRPDRENPPIDATRTIQADAGPSSELGAVLDRGCRDCHTNATVRRWYTDTAPLSWLMAYAVTTGREAVNFSEWDAYPPEAQRTLLQASCEDVTEGTMPGLYTWVRPETQLSTRDIETICTAARNFVAGGSRSAAAPVTSRRD